MLKEQPRQQQEQILTEFEKEILRLFRRLSVCILMLGRRDCGKTDASFLIAEILARHNIVKHFATNVRVYESDFPVDRITNLDDLRFWCKNRAGRKLFILDEAGKSLRRRTPMSSLNIKLLDELQILRKYQLSLILIAPHEKYIDTAALGTDVLDAVIIKNPYGLENVIKGRKIALYEDLFGERVIEFHDFPPTNVRFDTWDVAPFTEKAPTATPKFKDRDLQILWEWSHGKTAKELGLHFMQINRLVRKFIKEVMERETSHLTNKIDRE